LTPEPPRQTAGGKITLRCAVTRDGKPIDSLSLSDSEGGRDAAVKRLAAHGASREEAEAAVRNLLLWAGDQLRNQPAVADGDTVLAIVAAKVPDMLEIAYRTARGLRSNAEDRDMARTEFLAYTPSELLDAAAAGVDAPADWYLLLKMVEKALAIVWADLRRSLKPAAELDEDTADRRAFRDAIVRTWSTLQTWQVDRTAEGSVGSRVSLAGMVQRQAAGRGRLLAAHRDGGWQNRRTAGYAVDAP
jgi:hypothetical protein